MAEIKVKLTGDNADFKRKLAEASAESRAAASQIQAHFAKANATIAEIGSAAGLGKVESLLGSLKGGALAFGAALLAGVTDSVAKVIEMQGLVARMGTQAGSQAIGKDMENFINSILTIGPNKTEMVEAAGTLFDARMSSDEIKKWLPRLQRLSVGTGKSVGELAEDVAAGNVGITRRFQRDPLLRAAAMEFPGRTPLEALAATADPGGKFFSAITDQLATPEGQAKLAGVQTGKVFGGLAKGVMGDMGTLIEGIKTLIGTGTSGGVRISNPAIYGGQVPAGTIIGNPIQDLNKAATDIKEGADTFKSTADAWATFSD